MNQKSEIFFKIIESAERQYEALAIHGEPIHMEYRTSLQTFVFGRLTDPQAHTQGYYWHMTVWATSEIDENKLDVRELFNPTTKLYDNRFEDWGPVRLIPWFAERVQWWNIEQYEKTNIEPIKKWYREQDLYAYYRKSYSDRRKQDRMFRNQFPNNSTFR